MQIRRLLLGLSVIGAVAVFAAACTDVPTCGNACLACEATCCDGTTPTISGRVSSKACVADAEAECASHGGVSKASWDVGEIDLDGMCCRAACCDGKVPNIDKVPNEEACAEKSGMACAEHNGVLQGYFGIDRIPIIIKPNQGSCTPNKLCTVACCNGSIRTKEPTDGFECYGIIGSLCEGDSPFEAFYEGNQFFKSQTSPVCSPIAPCQVFCNGIELVTQDIWDCNWCMGIAINDCPNGTATIMFNGSSTCPDPPLP